MAHFKFIRTLGWAVVLALFVSVQLFAQAEKGDKRLFELRLKKAQQAYLKGMTAGDSKVILPLAEAYFQDTRYAEAYEYYRQADSAGQLSTASSQRNYVHSALRLGKTSPYFKRTDYFSTKNYISSTTDTTVFNSANEDFAPLWWQEKVFVTSSRTGIRNRDKFDYVYTQMPYLDVYVLAADGAAADQSFLPKQLNTPLHDGPIALKADTSLLVVTRTRPRADDQKVQQLYLDYFVRTNGEWSAALSFPYNQATASLQHPYFNEKEGKLYYASNEAGSAGGFDLYRIAWQDSVWGQPERLSNEVNTIYDEVFPAFNPAGELFYATNHPETRGGLDIVYLRKGKRILLPEPLNTVYDDFGISFRNDSSGYFSSNRNERPFDDDIYAFGLQEIIPEYPMFVRIGDKEHPELKADPKMRVVMYNKTTGDSIVHIGSNALIALGSFMQPLPEWGIKVSSLEYYGISVAQLNFKEEDNGYFAEISLERVKLALEAKGYLAIYFQNGEPRPLKKNEAETLDYSRFYLGYIKAKPVYYQKSISEKAELDAFFQDIELGMGELKKFPGRLDSALQTGRKMKVYMAAFTSASGSAAINKVISERRGLVLKNYIVNWNNGALEKYINSGQLTVSDEYFPMSAPDIVKGAKATVKAGPAVTVFGVPASRNRRVNVVWETID